MARISSSITESELDHTVNWRFSIGRKARITGTVEEMLPPEVIE